MSSPTSQRAPVIVKHPGCPQWGLGYLVEERDDKRFYDFEDGQSHSIAKPYWSKLEPVDLGSEELAALEAKIKGLREKPAPSKKPRARTVRPPSTSLDEQLARFEKDFPGGFSGEVFVAEERGVIEPPADPAAKKKAPKAYKEQAITTAAELLVRGEIAEMIASGRAGEVVERVKRVHQAAGGLLHPLGDLIPFGKMPAEHHAAFAEAVMQLLFGEGDYGPRFDRFVEVLAADKLNTWPLATVLSALLLPSEHVFVKPSFYEKQAAVLGYDLAYDRVPSAAGYARMQGLARELRARLEERGQKPRDLLDVYSFLWRMNTSPKAAPPAKGSKAPPPQSQPPPSSEPG